LTDFRDFVHRYVLVGEGKCYRHCTDRAILEPLAEASDSFVGGYTCPGGYVSRVVYVAAEPDAQWFKRFLSEQVGDSRVRNKDLRFATRHGWELGREAEKEIGELRASGRGIRQYYWVFYPGNEQEKQVGTFLCAKDLGGCGKLFTQPIAAAERLCPRCSRGKSSL
jgi:hypothetical protein